VGGVVAAILLALYSAERPALSDRLGWNFPELSNPSQRDLPSDSGVPEDDRYESLPEHDAFDAEELTSRTLENAGEDDPPAPAQVSPGNSSAPVVENKPAADDSLTTEKRQTEKSNGAQGGRITTKNGSTIVEAKPIPQNQKVDDKHTPVDDSNLRFGVLREVGRDEYLSPAGLRYTRGSAEGHRLKHLERHVADQPTRPGRHGVFLGGMTSALQVIDEAYLKAQQGGKGVTKDVDREYPGRVIYTVDLRRKIGYIGGAEGNRMNKPTAFKVQLVLDGDRVITSYPR
jgi:hypothetical protein